MIDDRTINDQKRPTRDDVRLYVIDMLGQLARMATRSGDRELATRIHGMIEEVPAPRRAG